MNSPKIPQKPKAFQHQVEYYQTLFANSPVAMVTVDLDGNVVSWNQAAVDLFEYSEDEVVGQKLDDLVAKSEMVREEAAQFSEQVFNMEHIHTTTKRTRKDGSLVAVEILAFPVEADGELIGSIAI